MTVSLSLFILVFAKRSPSEFLLIKTQKIHTHPLFLLITTVIKESKAIRLDDQLARSQLTLILKIISFISRVFIYLAFVSCAWRVNANYFLRSPTSIAIQETISAMLLYRCIFIRPREYYCGTLWSSINFCSTRTFPVRGTRYWSSQASAEMIRPYIKEYESRIWFLMLPPLPVIWWLLLSWRKKSRCRGIFCVGWGGMVSFALILLHFRLHVQNNSFS